MGTLEAILVQVACLSQSLNRFNRVSFHDGAHEVTAPARRSFVWRSPVGHVTGPSERGRVSRGASEVVQPRLGGGVVCLGLPPAAQPAIPGIRPVALSSTARGPQRLVLSEAAMPPRSSGAGRTPGRGRTAPQTRSAGSTAQGPAGPRGAPRSLAYRTRSPGATSGRAERGRRSRVWRAPAAERAAHLHKHGAHVGPTRRPERRLELLLAPHQLRPPARPDSPPGPSARLPATAPSPRPSLPGPIAALWQNHSPTRAPASRSDCGGAGAGE